MAAIYGRAYGKKANFHEAEWPEDDRAKAWLFFAGSLAVSFFS
jgi:hypothetical protein